MEWAQLIAEIEVLRHTSGSAVLSGIEYDSRRIQPGSLFVAMRGETTDGNRYLESAIAHGAAAILTDSPAAYDSLLLSHPRLPIALVSRGRRALAEATAALLHHPERGLALSAVTGTNGKTTTTYLLDSMLRSAGRRSVLLGTIEYHVGDEVRPSLHTTPESRDILQLFADGVRAGATEAVMEVSSHALDQERVWGLPVDVAVFTNLTQDHLDYHHTMEQYFAAKARLFEGVGTPPPRVAILNRDDPYGQRLIALAKHSQVVTYGLHPQADLRAEDISIEAGRTRLRMTTPSGAIEITSPLTGRVNVSNLLAASAAALARGLTLDQIASAASNASQVPGRFQVIPSMTGITVVVDYAHTDDALRNLIALARELASQRHGRVITLFGCGGDRDRTKRPRMGRAAAEGSDLVVLTSDNPRTEDPAAILDEALAGVRETDTPCIVEEDRARAIGIAIRSAQPNDIVLLAGKGHEKVQILRDRILPFDDAAVAAHILEEIAS